MISFMLCYVSWTSLIRLKIYANLKYEYEINEDVFNSNIRCTISLRVIAFRALLQQKISS